MKIKKISIYPFKISLKDGNIRSGFLINITNTEGKEGWGEVAPLPLWSKETLDDCIHQYNKKKEEILTIRWDLSTCLTKLKQMCCFPSLTFGLESALLSLLSPLADYQIPVSALLMGSSKHILEQANLRYKEGYISAKLKVNKLTFKEAKQVIDELKNKFFLRIDVNRAWTTAAALDFFSQYAINTFDYVEEPFQNPQDLSLFTHPLAIDESFHHNLSLKNLSILPTLKAVVYKPTIHGGLLGCVDIYQWCKKNGISLVLSSSFESETGLVCIASLAKRLSLTNPIGIGTYHYLNPYFNYPLSFQGPFLKVNSYVTPNLPYPLV